MKHPDFKHRAMPEGGDYNDFSEIDLLAFVSDKVSVIEDEIDLVSCQFKFPDEQRRLDQSNLNTMNAILDNVFDLKVMFEWFLQNHEIVRTEAYHPEDYEDDPIEPGSKVDKTLN